MEDKKFSPMPTFKFPVQMKRMLNQIRNEKQWKILEILMNHEKLSYTEIRVKTGLTDESKGGINYHLKELEKSGWIENESIPNTDFFDQYSSYYRITKFANDMIKGMLDSIERPFRKQLRAHTDIFQPLDFNRRSLSDIENSILELGIFSFFDSPRTVTETVRELRKIGKDVNALDVSKSLEKIATRNMTSRYRDVISATPTQDRRRRIPVSEV